MKNRIILTAALALAATTVIAAPHMLERADSDGDGMLSLQEMQAAHSARAAEKFEKLDANADGLISDDELEAAHAERRDKRKARRGGAHGIEKFDGDGDGYVSLTEFTDVHTGRLQQRFTELDANADGVLTEDEIQDAREQRRKKPRSPRYD